MNPGKPINIDGSLGEGGGQVLRTSLSLSLLTGQPFLITSIRASRSQPGLRPQHLKAVEAARKISSAKLDGAAVGSSSLYFEPGEVHPGRYSFEIKTAGATGLVLQTIFLPLSMCSAATTISITGGTHVPWSPSFHYLDLHWLPFMKRAGFDATFDLLEAGFYPQGGGRIQATVRPVQQVHPLVITERGQLRQVRGLSTVSNLDRKIAKRQREQVIRRLGARFPLNDIRVLEIPSRFMGTMLLLLAEFEFSQCCYFALGAKGKPAEQVANEAVDALEAFLATDGAIDQYLADQLLLPLSIADGISQLRTSMVTNHLVTNARIIQAFLPAKIEIRGEIGEPGSITIDPAQSVRGKGA